MDGWEEETAKHEIIRIQILKRQKKSIVFTLNSTLMGQCFV